MLELTTLRIYLGLGPAVGRYQNSICCASLKQREQLLQKPLVYQTMFVLSTCNKKSIILLEKPNTLK